MIQVYLPSNTAYDNNGDISLMPTEATVHAVLGGEWEATLTHPIDDEGRWSYIQCGSVIRMPSFLDSDSYDGDQLYRVISVETTDAGIVATMQPIFFDAADDAWLVDVRPTSLDGQAALDHMIAGSTAPDKYTAESDIDTTNTAYYEGVNLLQAISGSIDQAFVTRWGAELLYDNFCVIAQTEVGSDNGVEIRYGKNLPEDGMTVTEDMTDVVTRIYPKGYNGRELSTSYVDSPLIDDYPIVYCATITLDNIKLAEDLDDDYESEDDDIICETEDDLDAALIAACNEQYNDGIDKPSVTIECDMVMLQYTDQYADVEMLESVSLGDTIACINNHIGYTTSARVIELEYDALLRKVTSVVLGDYETDYFADAESTVTALQSELTDLTTTTAEFETVITESLYALQASISDLDVDTLTAVSAQIEELQADLAVIDELYASVANINTILSGSIGSGEIETIYLTSSNVVIEDAIITDAMIASLSASKITAGTIYTSLVTIQTSEDSDALYITDSLIQMRDSDGATRVQLGLDGEGDYNYYIFDASGNILFDALGIYGEGIHDGVIVNDHVADTSDTYSGISGSKLDIDSVITSINEDGTVTIEGSSITIDGETLEYKLTTITTAISDLETDTATLTTDLTVVQGQISTLIEYTDIESWADLSTTIYTAYTSLSATVDGLTSTVSTLETSVTDISSEVTSIYSTIEQTAESILSTVSSTYVTTTTYNSGISVLETAIEEADAAADAANTTAESAYSAATAVYGTCSTAASTAAKVVTCSDFALYNGACITVTFTYANTAGAITLNVNSTGALSIYVSGATASTSNYLLWAAGACIQFVYNGTYWVYAGGATSYKGTCSTAAATQAKTMSQTGAVICKGTNVDVTWTYGNTYASGAVTFNLGSTAAKNVYYGSAVTSTSNILEIDAAETLSFTFSGAYWYVSESAALTRIETATSTLESSIEQTAESILLEVSETYLTTDNLEGLVTAWNLLDGSSTEWGNDLTCTDTTNCCLKIVYYLYPEEWDVETGDKIWVGFDLLFSDDFVETGTGTAKHYVQGNKNSGGTWVTLSMTGGNQADAIAEIYESDDKTGHVSTYFLITDDMLDGTYSGKMYINVRFDYCTGTVQCKNVMVGKAETEPAYAPSLNDYYDAIEDTQDNVRSYFAMDSTSIEISSGTITFDAATIVIDSTYFTLSSTGVITATSGTIGAITLSTTGLYAYNSSYSASYSGIYRPSTITTSSIAFFAGATAKSGTSAVFKVTYGGALTATNATISGTITATAGTIGGLTIGEDYLTVTGSEYDEYSETTVNYTITLNASPSIGSGLSRGEYSKSYCLIHASSWGGYKFAFDSNGVTWADYLDAAYLLLEGNGAITGTLKVTGAVTLSSTLAVTGAITASSTLAVTGAITASSTITASGSIYANDATGIYFGYGSTYHSMIRNDDSTFYILLTDSGESDWNSLRPFTIKKSVGTVYNYTHVGLRGSSEYYPHLFGNDTYLQISYTDDSSSGLVLQSTSVRPAVSATYTLGSSSKLWSTIYSSSSSISTSDERQKSDITDVDEDLAVSLITSLEPVTYKLNDGQSGRKHWGFTAQQMEEVMSELGIESTDLAAFVKTPIDEDGEELDYSDVDRAVDYIYGMRYEELIAPLVKTVQAQQREIAALKAAINT